MKLVYVIGPLRSDNAEKRNSNIKRAGQVALDFWEAGFAVICPHLNSNMAGNLNSLDEQVFVDGDLVMLKHCDFAVVLDGWDGSIGSIGEIDFCAENSIPYYFLRNTKGLITSFKTTQLIKEMEA